MSQRKKRVEENCFDKKQRQIEKRTIRKRSALVSTHLHLSGKHLPWEHHLKSRQENATYIYIKRFDKKSLQKNISKTKCPGNFFFSSSKKQRFDQKQKRSFEKRTIRKRSALLTTHLHLAGKHLPREHHFKEPPGERYIYLKKTFRKNSFEKNKAFLQKKNVSPEKKKTFPKREKHGSKTASTMFYSARTFISPVSISPESTTLSAARTTHATVTANPTTDWAVSP